MGGPVALVDCNNFYVSCERIFQAELRGTPVVALSNNDGCVIARSNEAKALGIPMGAPWHLHKAQFESAGVIVRSSNYTRYGDMSARVMTILSTFSPDLEIYSIDEAFLGMAGFGDCLEAHARALCAAVLQCTGIPVSVGIAPTKTLAKVANHIAKKDEKHRGAVLLLDEPLQIEALSRLNLTDLWGIAGRLAAKLSLLGIMSPLDLRRADPLFLRDRLGVAALRMAMELRGVACLDLEQSTPDRKSIMASRSFDREDVAAVVSDDQKERLGWDGVIGGRHAPVYHESPWEIARMEGHAPREARGTFRGIAVRRSANYAGPCACLTDGCSSVP